MRASKGHSRPGEPRQKNKSGCRKHVSQQGALTNLRAQTEKQVRTLKECEPARGTHVLEGPGRETSQNTERMQANKGHSQTGEPRQIDRSEHGKSVSQQGALTSWRAQTERQVRTQKEYEPARGTHKLESPDEETSRDTKRMQVIKGNSHSGEPGQKDRLGHEMDLRQQGALTFWRAQT
jgi:hypothetical protein